MQTMGGGKTDTISARGSKPFGYFLTSMVPIREVTLG
jgi:hypothetical protein